MAKAQTPCLDVQFAVYGCRPLLSQILTTHYHTTRSMVDFLLIPQFAGSVFPSCCNVLLGTVWCLLAGCFRVAPWIRCCRIVVRNRWDEAANSTRTLSTNPMVGAAAEVRSMAQVGCAIVAEPCADSRRKSGSRWLKSMMPHARPVAGKYAM